MTKKEWDRLVDEEPKAAERLVLEKVYGFDYHRTQICSLKIFSPPYHFKGDWAVMGRIIEIMEEKGFDWLIAPDEAYFSKGQFFYQSDYQFGSEFRSDISRPRAVATAAMIALGEVEPEGSESDENETEADNVQ